VLTHFRTRNRLLNQKIWFFRILVLFSWFSIVFKK